MNRDAGKRREKLSYNLGDMGFVPRRDAVLLTNFDKMQQQVYPARERDTIRRAAKISVAVQTPGLSRVCSHCFFSFLLISVLIN